MAAPQPVDPSSEVELGFVTGVFGFRGEVRLFLHNPESTWLRSPRRVGLVAPSGARTQVELSARPGAGNRIIGRVVGVDTEEGATALRDHRVVVAKSALPALDEGEVYVWQLEGAEVRCADVRLGQVVGVQQAGPNDLLEVALDRGDTELVPMLSEFVTRIDRPPGAPVVIHLTPDAIGGAEEE
ncbi:MAG: ribosome maturation factor RimM [Myxococcota bacterium]